MTEVNMDSTQIANFVSSDITDYEPFSILNTTPALSNEYVDFTQIGIVYYMLVIISLFIVVFGIAGNLMVITVILKHKSMKTPTNYYIVSLALSDLLVLAFVMPLKMTQFLSSRIQFSDGICRVTEFFNPFFVFTSIWTLVSISIDRYLVIIHPLKSRSFNTKTRAARNLLFVWVVPIFLISPYFIFPFYTFHHKLTSHLGETTAVLCIQNHTKFEAWAAIDRVFMFMILYLVPVVILAFTCGSIARRLLRMTEDDKMLKNSVKKENTGRKKVAKMVLVIVLAFWICWTPYFLIGALHAITHFLEVGNFIFANVLIHICAFFNSTLNPILYALMSQAFRRGFWEILTCCCPRYRYLVGNRDCARSDRRSVTAMSHSDYNNHDDKSQNRRKLMNKEVTQMTSASNSDGEEEICLKKMAGNGQK